MSAYNAMEMAQIKNQIAQYEANRAAAESIITMQMRRLSA